MRTSRGMLDAVDDIVDYRALVPLRIASGFLVLAHLWPFLESARTGETYRDAFWVSYGSWYPQLPEPIYVAALAAAAVAAVALSLGLFTRIVASYTAAFVVYNLFVSQTHYHHNRAFLAVILIGLAMTPVGGAVSLDARRARKRDRTSSTLGVRWPLMLLRFQVAVVYAASGFSKLIDPDWFGGTVTRLRIERDLAAGGAGGIPTWAADALGDPGLHAAGAKVVVLAELFIGLGLLVPRTRLAAVWVAISFHMAIELSADVQLFSYAALAALVIWVTPRSRDRTVRVDMSAASGRRRVAAIRLLDWTARFRIVAGAPPESLELHDRGGAVFHGATARWIVASRLPVAFWLAGPVAALRRRAVQPGDVVSSSSRSAARR